METTKLTAIILKSTPYEERHRIVNALTEDYGKVSALARNAIQSRRFGGTLEIFSASEWLVTIKPHSELWTLNEAHVKRSFEGIRKDFEKLSVASALSEIALRISQPGENSSDLFKLHSNALAIIEETSSSQVLLPIFNAYLVKILHWSGTQPLLQACLLCKTSLNSEMKTIRSIVSEAGWLCQNCLKDRAVSGSKPEEFFDLKLEGVLDAFQALQHPIRKAVESLHGSAKDHQDLARYLLAMLRYHVPGFDRSDLKSIRFFLKENHTPHEGSF
jgi:DNA repair protein RecO